MLKIQIQADHANNVSPKFTYIAIAKSHSYVRSQGSEISQELEESKEGGGGGGDGNFMMRSGYVFGKAK